MYVQARLEPRLVEILTVIVAEINNAGQMWPNLLQERWVFEH